MARIPGPEELLAIQPAQVGGAPAPGPAQPLPDYAGQALDQGLDDAGRFLGQMARMQRESLFSETRAEALTGLEQLHTSLQEETDPAALGRKWQEGVSRVRQKAAERLGQDEGLKQQFANDMGPAIARMDGAMLGRAAVLTRDRNRAALGQELTASLGALPAARDAEAVDLVRANGLDSIARSLAVGALTAEEAQQATAVFLKDVDGYLAQQDIQADPAGALARLKDPKQYEGLDLKSRSVLLGHAQEKHNTWVKTAGEQLYVEQAQALGVGVEQQIRWVRKNTPAELREGVESRLWADASHRLALADKARAEAERASLGQVVDMLHKGAEPGKVMDFIETSPGLSPAQKVEWRQHAANWGRAQAKQGDDPETARALWGLVGRDPDTAKLAILQARLRGSLTETTKDQMLQNVDQLAKLYGPELAAWDQQVDRALSTSVMGPGDPTIAMANAKAKERARLLVRSMLDQGKSPLEVKQALSIDAAAQAISEARPSVADQFEARKQMMNPGGKGQSKFQIPNNGNAVPLSTDPRQPDAPWPPAGAAVDEALALRLLNAANGDKQKARELARQKGYVIPSN